jgi:pyruvate kinase
MARRTKIVATLGPASDAREVLGDLVRAGVDVVRLNLSHGDLDDHVARMRAVREVAAEQGRVVAVLADLPGPKVRCGRFGDRGVHLATGSTVTLRPGRGECDETTVYVDYDGLLADVAVGDTVIVGDGGITLTVVEVDADQAAATVVTGGRATGSPGFHIPSERLRLATPTDEDVALLRRLMAVDDTVDFVAVSFVRTAHDLREVRRHLGDRGPQVVAKIETVPAVQHLDEILDEADAVMVARGDLGIEMPLEAVPNAQKRIIRACVASGVPVITATQMLESMINSPSPTRAEVSDVANAVLDGTDAVMLSGETAIGHDPALVVRTMGRIAERAEADADYSQWGGLLAKRLRSLARPTPITQAITHAAWQACQDLGAEAILCSTRSGLTARAMARFRPRATLVGLSPDDRTVRALALVWGVTPRLVLPSSSTDDMVWHAVETAAVAGDVAQGAVVAVLARSPQSPDDSTDVLRLVRVG